MTQQLNNSMMNDEFERLKTYPIQWPLGPNKGELAKDGFYYIGGVIVQCFSCLLQLTLEARESTHVRNIHIQKSPTCLMMTNPRMSGNRHIPHTKIYQCERDRLISFLTVNFTWPVDVNELAKSGFYYDTTKKSSCCYTCKLQIGSWSEGDTGTSEHEKYNSQCLFFNKNPSVENVPLGEEDTPEAKKIIDAKLLDVQTLIDQPGEMAKKIANIREPPKHNKYKTKRDRIASYTTWPASMKQRPGELADAGFYYSSRGDRVICYQCGKGLRDWGINDRPWNEHAYFYPDCPLVVAVMGPSFVDKVKAAPRDPNATIRALPNPDGPDDEPMQEEKENVMDVNMDEGKEIRQCKVCFTNELGIVFLPCSHMATCPDCAPQLSTCPICRSNFTAYVRAFLPK